MAAPNSASTSPPRFERVDLDQRPAVGKPAMTGRAQELGDARLGEDVAEALRRHVRATSARRSSSSSRSISSAVVRLQSSGSRRASASLRSLLRRRERIEAREHALDRTCRCVARVSRTLASTEG